MKRTQIYLEDEQDRRLAEEAKGSGRTKSEIIRRAIDAHLNDKQARLERFREAVQATAGIAPYLPDGKTYVEELRRNDARRQEDLERRWRS